MQALGTYQMTVAYTLNCVPKRHVEALTPSACGYDVGTLCGNRVTVGVISSSRVAPIQCDLCPNKKEKFGHKQAIRENPLLGSGPP